MATRPSIKEVARQRGRLLGTVSNVLNRPELVADGHPAPGARRHHRARLRPQRLGPPAARRAQPADRHRRARRGQPVLHRRRPRRGGRRRAAGVVVVVCNSGEDAGREQPPPRPAGGAAGPGRAHHPGRRRPELAAGAAHRSAAPRSCWSTAARAGTTAARWPSTTCSAGGSPASTCSSRATSGSPSSAARSASPGAPTGTRLRRRPCAGRPSCSVVDTPNLTVAAGRAAAGRDRRPAAANGRPRSSAPTTCSPSACCRR